MKKIYTLLFILISFGAYSQNSLLKFIVGDTVVAKKMDQTEYVAHSFIKNISSAPLKIVWKRKMINSNESCEAQTCDKNLCYGGSVNYSIKVINLAPNDSSIIDLHYAIDCCEPDPNILQMTFCQSIDTSVNLVSAIFTCGVISDIQYFEDSKLKITPNPTSDLVTLNISNFEADKYQYQVMNLNGTIIKSNTILQNNQTVDLSSFANGMYFIRILDDHKVSKVEKIVLQH